MIDKWVDSFVTKLANQLKRFCP